MDLELEQQQLFDGPDIEGTHVEYHHLCLGLGAREEEKARPVDLRGDDQEVGQNGLLERLPRSDATPTPVARPPGGPAHPLQASALPRRQLFFLTGSSSALYRVREDR